MNKASHFKLNKEFVDSYKIKPSPFKTTLGEVVFYRTYSRLKENGKKESWVDCIERVVNGVYSYQKRHCDYLKLHWSYSKAQRSAQRMFDKIFNMKFLPPGRGLYMSGTKFVDEKNNSMPLYNCAFVSTENIRDELTLPFTHLFNSLFLGVGVGFDVLGAGHLTIKKPNGTFIHVIEDTREAWTLSLDVLLQAYFQGKRKPIFDYSKIRKAGLPLKSFGGTSSGPGPLKELHEAVEKVYEKRIGEKITSADIVDTMCLIGRAVVAGSIRRSAEIALGKEEDQEFLDLKDFNKHPEEVQSHRWMSNNSIFAYVNKTDYRKILNKSGEVPGLFWIENARSYGRMKDPKNFNDNRIAGINPCSEQVLESYEMCNLVEVFSSNHETYEDFKETLKMAYLYNKSVTLIPTDSSRVNAVQMRNRRLGISQTGITAAFEKHGASVILDWFDRGYEYLKNLDKIYSDWLCIPKSVKLTTVKPSGSVSLLAGVPPGVHYPHSQFYIRRMKIGIFDPILKALTDAGYEVEDDYYGGKDSASLQKVVSFPVKEEQFSQGKDDVSIWQQVKLVSLMQRYWSDNSVSVTVTFNKEEEKEIVNVLEFFERDLKTISFLPLLDHNFPQAPYETITEEKYNEMASKIKVPDFSELILDGVGSKFCDAESCEI